MSLRYERPQDVGKESADKALKELTECRSDIPQDQLLLVENSEQSEPAEQNRRHCPACAKLGAGRADGAEITVEYINSLPILSFHGSITIVDDAAKLEKMLGILFSEKSVGFDTESRPSFTKGKTYPISLIQLSTLNEAFIVRFNKIGFPDGLHEFLESNVEKVGLGLKDDIRKMKELRAIAPKAMIDLCEIAKSKGYQKSSLRALSAIHLQHRIVKSSQKTNWARATLTEQQLRYAATDAWACLLIRPLLEAVE